MYAKSLLRSCNYNDSDFCGDDKTEARHQVNVQVARKLAPTLIIIEDIDTAGTVSRKFTDHPILGEYLQSMDGMDANNGILVLATTNHTENIDPGFQIGQVALTESSKFQCQTKHRESRLSRICFATCRRR